MVYSSDEAYPGQAAERAHADDCDCEACTPPKCPGCDEPMGFLEAAYGCCERCDTEPKRDR